MRYQTDPRYLSDRPRSLLLDHESLLPSNGQALDIAMGPGENASFLIHRGLRVIRVDISYVAVRRTKEELLPLMGVVADLEHFQIPQNAYYVILNFLYLQRNLWTRMMNGLKIGGKVFIECLLE